MGNVVNPQGQPLNLEDNHEFISDCCRFFENLLSEAAMRRKYRFSDDVWERLGSDEKLIEAVEAEKIRRIRDGSSKRERAQLLVTKAPDVLSGIMLDPAASPKHKIDSAKVLDQFAANGPEAAPAADRFVITINLGADVLKFDKSIAIDANDVDPNDTSTTPRGLLPIIAANKRKDDGSGEPV